MIDWRIRGREFANCNCDYGCPCQFNALPTHGNCEAAVGFQIDQGHFGDVKLDGLRAAGVYSWPKAVHEGNGTMQLIVDEKADEAQRDALLRIMRGEETEPMATMWSVYAHMTTTVLEPLFKPIDFEVDVEARTARLSVPRRSATSTGRASTCRTASNTRSPRSAAARQRRREASNSTWRPATASSPSFTSRTPASCGNRRRGTARAGTRAKWLLNSSSMAG